MLDWLSIQWSKRPLAVFGGIFAVALTIESIVAVWGERRPIGGFFEEFVARAMHWGIGLGSLAAGIWAGTKVYERTKSNAVAWIIGVLSFVAVLIATDTLTARIPGVGWRMDRMISDVDPDY